MTFILRRSRRPLDYFRSFMRLVHYCTCLLLPLLNIVLLWRGGRPDLRKTYPSLILPSLSRTSLLAMASVVTLFFVNYCHIATFPDSSGPLHYSRLLVATPHTTGLRLRLRIFSILLIFLPCRAKFFARRCGSIYNASNLLLLLALFRLMHGFPISKSALRHVRSVARPCGVLNLHTRLSARGAHPMIASKRMILSLFTTLRIFTLAPLTSPSSLFPLMRRSPSFRHLQAGMSPPLESPHPLH